MATGEWRRMAKKERHGVEGRTLNKARRQNEQHDGRISHASNASKGYLALPFGRGHERIICFIIILYDGKGGT
jgi:hypothetical protein